MNARTILLASALLAPVAAYSDTQEQWLARALIGLQQPIGSWEGNLRGHTENFRVNQPWRICGYSSHAPTNSLGDVDGKLQIMIHGVMIQGWPFPANTLVFPRQASSGPICSAINPPGTFYISLAAEGHWALAAYYVDAGLDAELKAEMPAALPHLPP
jgi:hypothetical protein